MWCKKISDKLNYLFIFTDQQRADHLSCYNDNIILKTPNIDRIANEGIKFTNFYCNNPICMPNRSTIFTGQFPSVHGVTTNGRNLPDNTKTFVDILSDSGLYHTASFGKIHLNYFGEHSGKFQSPNKSREMTRVKNYPKLTKISPYFGIEEVKLISGHGIFCGHPDYINWVKKKIQDNISLSRPLRIRLKDQIDSIQSKLNYCFDSSQPGLRLQLIKHQLPEELYSTTFVKENTINFLTRFAEGKYSKPNFFAFCSFPDPHHPFSPPGKYFDMYKPEDVKVPKSFNDTHKNSSKFNRRHYNELINTEGTVKNIFPKPKDLTEEDAKRVIAASYGMEKMIDDAIGEIFETLENKNLLNKTVVIFTSDHGDLGGDHRFFFKGPFLYQGLIKIPFLIRIPDGASNQISDSITSSIDIPETILELTGFKIPIKMQGKSMVPILKNTKEEINEDVLIEMDDDHNNEKTRTLIRNNWRITVFSEHGELYNLKDDPEETNNLWENKSFGKIKDDLLTRLLRKCIQNQPKLIERDCGF